MGDKEDYTKPAPAHATSHELGGSDEISVDGLAGELADVQNAGAIKSVLVDDDDKADAFVLSYDAATETLKYVDGSTL
jgi:hypothetical protein